MVKNPSLDDLAEKLRAVTSRGLATQMDLSTNTGVDQATISRILNRQRRRMTDPLVALEEYVDMLLGDQKLSSEVQEAATAPRRQDFLVRGGTEAELIASIEHSAQLVLRKLR